MDYQEYNSSCSDESDMRVYVPCGLASLLKYEESGRIIHRIRHFYFNNTWMGQITKENLEMK